MQPTATDKADHSTNLGINVTGIRFCPKRDVLAVTTSRLTGNVWNGSFFVLGETGQIQHRIELENGCSALTWFGKDASSLLVASDDGITRLWTLKDERFQLQRTFDGHDDLITGISSDPFGDVRLLTSSYDRTVKLWSTESKEVMPELVLNGHADYVTAVEWSPKTVALFASSSWDRSLRLWDIRAKETSVSKATFTSKILTFDWASEFIIFLGTEYGSVTCLDTRKLEAPVCSAQVNKNLPVRSLRADPHNPERFVAGGDACTVHVYSNTCVNLFTFDRHSDFVSAVDWSHTQAKQVASGGFDKTVHRWKIPEELK